MIALSLMCGNTSACFGYTVQCEDKSISSDDCGAVDIEYHAIWPSPRSTSSNECVYEINVTYYPECNFDYSAKLVILNGNANLSLRNDTDCDINGVQHYWHFDGCYHAFFRVHYPEGTGNGTAIARVYFNDSNEHNTIDVFTTTFTNVAVPEMNPFHVFPLFLMLAACLTARIWKKKSC